MEGSESLGESFLDSGRIIPSFGPGFAMEGDKLFQLTKLGAQIVLQCVYFSIGLFWLF